jgi:16S rRNA processing protein RimM
MEARLTPVGTIVKVHGLHGEVVVNPTISQPEALETLTLFILENGAGFRQPVRVEKAKLVSKSGRYSFFVKFVRIDSRNDAQALVGGQLFIDALTARKAVPKAEASWDDVIGFQAKDNGNGFEGVVRSVLSGGGQALLEIQAEARLLLVPAVDAYVSGIEIRKKRISLQNTDVLLEI